MRTQTRSHGKVLRIGDICVIKTVERLVTSEPTRAVTTCEAAMTSSIDVLSVFADAAIVLALVGTVANPRVSPLTRLVIATFAFACAWLMTAVVDAIRAPGWTVLLGGSDIVLSIVLLTAALHRWTREPDGSEQGPHDGGGWDGPRPRPDAPQHGGGDNDLSWWPEFERQLASYVAERETENPQPAVRTTIRTG